MAHDAVIHLIDDDEGVRHSLAFQLTTAGFAVRVHESGSAFLDALDTVQRGCIISDVRMPGISGLDLQGRLKELGVNLPIIIMTGHADVPLAVEAMKAGAVDFIEKPFDDDVLIGAIHIALDRLDNTGQHDKEATTIQTRLQALTQRESQVMEGLLLGHPNKTIAYDLGLSPRTVEVHRASLMTKMGANSLSDLVRMAMVIRLPSKG
jgi:two-component system response regulator FixJ